jgi:hypothetical protein
MPFGLCRYGNCLALLLLACAGSAQIEQDAKLAVPISRSAAHETVGSLVEEISKLTSATFIVDPNLKHQRLAVELHRQPIQQVLAGLGTLFDASWRKNPEGYELQLDTQRASAKKNIQSLAIKDRSAFGKAELDRIAALARVPTSRLVQLRKELLELDGRAKEEPQALLKRAEWFKQTGLLGTAVSEPALLLIAAIAGELREGRDGLSIWSSKPAPGLERSPQEAMSRFAAVLGVEIPTEQQWLFILETRGSELRWRMGTPSLNGFSATGSYRRESLVPDTHPYLAQVAAWHQMKELPDRSIVPPSFRDLGQIIRALAAQAKCSVIALHGRDGEVPAISNSTESLTQYLSELLIEGGYQSRASNDLILIRPRLAWVEELTSLPPDQLDRIARANGSFEPLVAISKSFSELQWDKLTDSLKPDPDPLSPFAAGKEPFRLLGSLSGDQIKKLLSGTPIYAAEWNEATRNMAKQALLRSLLEGSADLSIASCLNTEKMPAIFLTIEPIYLHRRAAAGMTEFISVVDRPELKPNVLQQRMTLYVGESQMRSAKFEFSVFKAIDQSPSE